MSKHSITKEAAVGLLLTPLRIIILLGVFGPVILLFSTLEKIGEFLSEFSGGMLFEWRKLTNEFKFFTNAGEQGKVKKLVEEKERLRNKLERIKFIHPEIYDKFPDAS